MEILFPLWLQSGSYPHTGACTLIQDQIPVTTVRITVWCIQLHLFKLPEVSCISRRNATVTGHLHPFELPSSAVPRAPIADRSLIEMTDRIGISGICIEKYLCLRE